MTNPKISIIIPSYNQGIYLSKNLRSIIEQEYRNFEIIVIDGGSTDNSIEVLREFNSHIKYWVSEKDRGTFHADNKGLEHADGDYWCIVNSDDLLMPGALTEVVRVVRANPEAKWICGATSFIDKDGDSTSIEFVRVPERVGGFTFLHSCWISHPSVFLHKDVIHSIGKFGEWNCMDYEYWLRMENAGYFPVITDKVLSGQRYHNDCKSVDQLKIWTEVLKIRKKFIESQGIYVDPDLKKSLAELNYKVLELTVVSLVLDGKRGQAFNRVVRAVIGRPLLFCKRRFLGLVRRTVLGIESTDPVIGFLGIRGGVGNWHPVD